MIETQALTFICTNDFSGHTRGKAVPSDTLDDWWRRGVGWTPTNTMINPFGRIIATPWGSRGDLKIIPDATAELRLSGEEGRPGEHLILGDVQEMDGSAWSSCLRSQLRDALVELRQETGLTLRASMEHEFHYTGGPDRWGDSYHVDAFRGIEGFLGEVIGHLRANGIAPEMVLPEFGPRQLELTVAPKTGLRVADEAVMLREVVRATARRHGQRASFSPIVTRGIVGNGLHIHFSFERDDGSPVTYDASRPDCLSETAGRFVAGILRHSRALCAFTAPSVISYQRFAPNAWSAWVSNLGFRDRESLIRICPVPDEPDTDPSRSFNLEFRAADATGSPYLQLAALVRAGLLGIREELDIPPATRSDPGAFSAEECDRHGILPLPSSLEDALRELERDQALAGTFPGEMIEAYIIHKRGEMSFLHGRDIDEICGMYADVY